MEQTPLSDILNEEPTAETEAQAEVQTQPTVEAEPLERPRDEHGRFISKGEETEEVSGEGASPAPQEKDVPVGALTGERQRRQQAEQRATELEARLRQYDEHFARLQAPQQQQQIPDIFEDPDGFKAHLAQEIRNELMQEQQQSMQGNSMVTHAKFCEMLARRDHEDYDATVEIFKEELAVNPHLLTQLQKADDPAMYAYNVGKQVQAARSYGTEAPPSRDELKAQLREELIQELGLNRQQAPTTHAADRSVGARSGPAWSGPAPLSDLLS